MIIINGNFEKHIVADHITYGLCDYCGEVCEDLGLYSPGDYYCTACAQHIHNAHYAKEQS